MECLFCKIANKEIKSEMVYEDSDLVVIKDIHPQSSTHLLVLPKKHIATLNDVKGDDWNLFSRMAGAAQQMAKKMGIDQKGYRLVVNCNEEGGQTIFHLHLHLLGGRQLGGSMVG